MIDGDRYYPSLVLVDDVFDGQARSGNIVNLTGDQSVDYPVVHQYGDTDNSNASMGITGTNNTMSFDNTTNIFTIHLESDTGSAYRPQLIYATTYDSEKVYRTSFTVTVSSGQCSLNLLQGATSIYYNETLGVGTYYYEEDIGPYINGQTKMSFDGTLEYTCDFTVNFEVQELTNTDSYISYFDATTKQRVQNAATGTTLTVDFPHSDFVSADRELTSEDLAYCDAFPEAMMWLWMGTLSSLPSGFSKANIINYFPACEGILGGDTIYDITV